MPTPEAFQSDALKLVDQMKKLRNAPVVEEDYRGPVLFSNDAAADMFYDLIAPNCSVGSSTTERKSGRTRSLKLLQTTRAVRAGRPEQGLFPSTWDDLNRYKTCRRQRHGEIKTGPR